MNSLFCRTTLKSNAHCHLEQKGVRESTANEMSRITQLRAFFLTGYPWNYVILLFTHPAILLGSGSMWVVSSKYRHEIWFLTWYTLANLSSVR